MEKKLYIEPAMRVKAVNIRTSILAGSPTGNDEVGSGEELSKGIDLPEDDGNISTHDIWED